jgi:hypothetical protein
VLTRERGCASCSRGVVGNCSAYWPDFDPIEHAFSKIKGLLRKAEAWSPEALVQALDEPSQRSVQRTPEAFSSSVGTIWRFNHYGERCSFEASVYR